MADDGPMLDQHSSGQDIVFAVIRGIYQNIYTGSGDEGEGTLARSNLFDDEVYISQVNML